eukprot:scaffold221941_cov14-Tisochrysis_lutea.AAC.1
MGWPTNCGHDSKAAWGKTWQAKKKDTTAAAFILGVMGDGMASKAPRPTWLHRAKRIEGWPGGRELVLPIPACTGDGLREVCRQPCRSPRIEIEGWPG